MESRCEVQQPGQPTHRGTIKYVGKIEEMGTVMVGIEYDEPVGNIDGAIDGKRFFICKKNYGGFVKPSEVKCGDFAKKPETEDEI